MGEISLKPSKLSGRVKAISAKSYAHRLFIAAALSGEETEIICKNMSEDILTTINCLSSLGARFEPGIPDVNSPLSKQSEVSGFSLEKRGKLPSKLYKNDSYKVFPITNLPKNPKINCNESGSTFRFILPIAGALLEEGLIVEFSGSGKLPNRPIGELIQVMKEKCVFFSNQKLPFNIKGKLSAGEFLVPGNVSSQYISGLLLALPLLAEDSRIIINGKLQSESYVQMTIDVLQNFNIVVESISEGYFIKGGQGYKSPLKASVEGDWSNSAFFITAAALGSEIQIQGLNANSCQGDKKIVDILNGMGGKITVSDDIVTSKGGSLSGTEIDLADIPDLFPILAVAASVAQGKTIFRNTKRLRLKESDRIESVRAMLLNLGFPGSNFIVSDNSIEILGSQNGLIGGKVNSFNDHRIVMAAAIAATVSKGKVFIEGANSVEKSYPSFFEDYMALGGEWNVML